MTTQSTDELVRRLEDACCCEPDQGFEPCGACKDLAVIERLQRDLRECVELLEKVNASLEELYRHGEHPWRAEVRALLAQIKAGQRENHRCQHCGNYDCELHQERTS